MEKELIRQYHIQFCNLHAKVFYLVNFINLFTDGYAEFQVNKEYSSFQYTFAPSKAGWKSRLNEITGEVLMEHGNLPELEKPKWKSDEKYLQDWSDHIKKMKALIRIFDKFIADKAIDFENDMYWHTETIKYKVYSLEY